MEQSGLLISSELASTQPYFFIKVHSKTTEDKAMGTDSCQGARQSLLNFNRTQLRLKTAPITPNKRPRLNARPLAAANARSKTLAAYKSVTPGKRTGKGCGRGEKGVGRRSVTLAQGVARLRLQRNRQPLLLLPITNCKLERYSLKKNFWNARTTGSNILKLVKDVVARNSFAQKHP